MIGGLAAPALPLSVPPMYPAATGAAWGAAWCAAAAVAFLGWRRAPHLVIGVGAAFLTWYWFDRLVFVRSAYALRTLPFSLGLTALGAIAVIIILRQRDVRRFFEGPVDE